MRDIQKGKVDEQELTKAKAKIDALKLYIDDRPRLDINTIRGSARFFHESTPISLVVVDYLQLVKTRDRHSRDQEVGEITAELKALATELRCPVLVGSQLNRKCEERGKTFGDYKPILSDLRESGNIEQDADIIAFLSRQAVYDGTRPGDADIGIAKNRNGSTGNYVFQFSGRLTKFFDGTDGGGL